MRRAFSASSKSGKTRVLKRINKVGPENLAIRSHVISPTLCGVYFRSPAIAARQFITRYRQCSTKTCAHLERLQRMRYHRYQSRNRTMVEQNPRMAQTTKTRPGRTGSKNVREVSPTSCNEARIPLSIGRLETPTQRLRSSAISYGRSAA